MQGHLGTAQRVAFTAQRAGIPGAEAAGQIFQSAQTGMQLGGPAGAAIGAAIAVGTERKKQLEEAAAAAAKFGQSIASTDTEGAARGMVELAKKIPIFGEGFAKGANLVLDVSQSLSAEARRLSGYNAGLAVQSAMIDVRNTFRDIDRANRFAPELLAAQRADDQLQRTVADLQMKYLPMVANACVVGLKYIEFNAVLLDNILQANIKLGELMAQLPGINLLARPILDRLQQIANNTEREEVPFNADDFAVQLLNSTDRLDVSRAEEDRRARETRAQREGVQLQPMFPGL